MNFDKLLLRGFLCYSLFVMKPPRFNIKTILIFSILISCLTGFYSSLEMPVVPFYRKIFNEETSLHQTVHSWANDKFAQLKNSQLSSQIKTYLPSEHIVIGFYSDDASAYAGMMYAILQNLLIPVFIDRENPENHNYLILFLKNGELEKTFHQLNIKTKKSLGYNLYLAKK